MILIVRHDQDMEFSNVISIYFGFCDLEETSRLSSYALRGTITEPEKDYKMCHVMRKPVYAIYEQQRRRSSCATAQSDQRLCCSLPE